MSSLRRYLLPRVVMATNLPPVVTRRGTSPSEAPEIASTREGFALPIAATCAVAFSTPMEGMVAERRRHRRRESKNDAPPDD